MYVLLVPTGNMHSRIQDVLSYQRIETLWLYILDELELFQLLYSDLMCPVKPLEFTLTLNDISFMHDSQHFRNLLLNKIV